MGEQRDAAAVQVLAQRRVCEQPVDAELHDAGVPTACSTSSATSVDGAPISSTKPWPMVKVGFGGRVRERPIRHPVIRFFDHCGGAGTQWRTRLRPRQFFEVGDRLEDQAARHRSHGNTRRPAHGDGRHATAIIDEAIHGPLARRREIHFEIRGAVRQGHEEFETRVSPQAIRACGRARCRHHDAAHVCVEFETDREFACATHACARRQATHRAGGMRRVARERDRLRRSFFHLSILSGSLQIGLISVGSGRSSQRMTASAKRRHSAMAVSQARIRAPWSRP